MYILNTLVPVATRSKA